MLSVQRLIPYPPFHFDSDHVDDELLNDFISEHKIPDTADWIKLEDCADAIIAKSEIITTSSGEETVHVSFLAPDLLLSWLPAHEHLTNERISTNSKTRDSLGSGGFGTVSLGLLDENEVAFKIFSDIDTSANRSLGSRLGSHHCLKNLQNLLQEVTVMKQLQHQHIVQFKGVMFEPYPCLAMEYAPAGNLTDLISKYRSNDTNMSDLPHDGILGRELTHRIAFQVNSHI